MIGEQKQRRKDGVFRRVNKMDNDSLKTCLHRARRGDASAFGEIYEQYAAGLYRFALWYVKNPYDAEDAVQSCALNAYRNIASVKKAESFHAWIYKILANACRDILRDRQKRNDAPLEDADSAVFDRYEDDSVTRLLSALNEDDRKIVTLSVLGEFNSREISKMLGMNDSTVRTKLSRALKKLREQYE